MCHDGLNKFRPLSKDSLGLGLGLRLGFGLGFLSSGGHSTTSPMQNGHVHILRLVGLSLKILKWHHH